MSVDERFETLANLRVNPLIVLFERRHGVIRIGVVLWPKDGSGASFIARIKSPIFQ